MSFKDTPYQSLENLHQVCLKRHIPFASFRQPLQADITTFVQHRSYPKKVDFTKRPESIKGFVVAPFFETSSCNSFIMEPDDIFISGDITTEFILSLSENTLFLDVYKLSGDSIKTTSRDEFMKEVDDAKLAISAGTFHKVVLSKVRVQQVPDAFQASTFYLSLCEKYPHAFVYMIQLPEVGCWIGATPEPLLLIEDGKVKTVSLAGTQLATGNETDSYSWSDKETEEQGIVTGFVENTLHSLDIDHYTQKGPENYRAANLIHLKTSFEFNEADLGNRLADFLKALHPTPSVGGLPREAARTFILEHENYNRSYYTGFLGPVHVDDKSSFYVNLRCLQLFEKQFVLYSGAGITASSVAEREWEETDNKMLTMLNVMQST
jgi:isochorismate synthase